MLSTMKALLRLQACEFPAKVSPKAFRSNAKIGQAIQHLRSQLSSQILHEYDYRKPHFRDTSLVAVEAGICMGCRVRLSQRTLRLSYYRITECEHCGRLVYNPERPRRLRWEVCAA